MRNTENGRTKASVPVRRRRRRISQWFEGILLIVGLLFNACGGPPPPDPHLPPSASDFDALGALRLCERETRVVHSPNPYRTHHRPWGSGEEHHFELTSPRREHQWLFFDEDKVLVGAVFAYPQGINLAPYPILRKTLSQLPVSREFFLNAAQLLQGTTPDTLKLYRTGDAKTTTQYLVRYPRQDTETGELIVAAVVLDPYEPLLEASHPKFLNTVIGSPERLAPVGDDTTQSQQFLGTQQFARGETALFASCPHVQNRDATAIDAYGRAIQHGLGNQNRLAEAHHRLGLALRNTGRLNEAKREIEKALTILPHSPGMLNSLGSVLIQLKQPTQAITALEQAVALRPNYARARFNLAQAYETINTQRAIEEYETYLALVEGISEESTRISLAKDRLRRLQ